MPKEDRIQSGSALRTLPNSLFQSLREKEFQQLAGNIIWIAISRRPLLSTLRVALHHDCLYSTPLRCKAASEIRKFSSLACLARVSIARPIDTLLIATDASPWRGAVTWALAEQSKIKILLETSRHVRGEFPDRFHAEKLEKERE